VIAASIALFFSVAAWWAMPVFAGGAILAGMVAALLAICCAIAGAPRTSLVAIFFCIAASAPFWVPRGSTFRFEQGYLWLGPIGFIFATVLLILWKRNGTAT
jgi:hypothetical protein